MIKTAIIGLGRIGWQFHLPQVVHHSEYSLIAVVDPLKERLDAAKEKYGVRGYTDHQTMLACEKPQLVVIASPTMFHQVDESLAAPGRAYASEVILWKTMNVPILATEALDYYEVCADYFGADGEAPISIEETLYVMELMQQCREQNEGRV